MSKTYKDTDATEEKTCYSKVSNSWSIASSTLSKKPNMAESVKEQSSVLSQKSMKKFNLLKTLRGGREAKLVKSKKSDDAGDSSVNKVEIPARLDKATSTTDVITATERDYSMFECNICLEVAQDAVVSRCGHLYCWPCLHLWLNARPIQQLCPVCKGIISKETVIPLYGRNSKKEDPRNKTPDRPTAQRIEPIPPIEHQLAMMLHDDQITYIILRTMYIVYMVATFPYHAQINPIFKVMIYFALFSVFWLIVFALHA